MTTDPREMAAAAIALAKPRLRGWLHAVTSPLALACAVVLIVLAPSWPATLAALAFGGSAVAVFTTSAIYHRGTWSPRAERWLKRADHANIFLLIAGSYTPFAVLALHGTTRVVVLTAVGSVAILGVAFRLVWVVAPRGPAGACDLGRGSAAPL